MSGYSFDFVYTEQGIGWFVSHVTNPMIFYLYWQSYEWTMLVFLLNEILEAVYYVFFRDNFFLFGNETYASSLVGDVLLNGTLGLLIGTGLATVFRTGRLIQAHEVASWRLALWIAHQLNTLFLLLNWQHYYALIIVAVMDLVFITINACTRPTHSKAFFVTWGISSILLHVPVIAMQGVMASDWFVVWIFGSALVVSFHAIALLRKPFQSIISLMVLVALALLIIGQLTDLVGVRIVGAIVAVAASIVGAWMAIQKTQKK